MLRLEHLSYVIEVSKEGSINRAAEKLFLSQPYLSSCLKDLENQLGVALFKRSNKGVVLTDAGEKFLSYAQEIEDILFKIEHLKNDAFLQNSCFRVSSMYSFTMLDLFWNYKQAHQSEKIHYSYTEMQNTLVPLQVKNGDADFGFYYYTPEQESAVMKDLSEFGLQFTELCQERLFAVLSSKHPLARQKAVTLKELSSYSLVIEKHKKAPQRGTDGYNVIFPHAFKQFKTQPIVFDNNRSLMYFITKSDDCFTIGQKCLNLSNPFLQTGEIVYLPISDLETPIHVGVIERIGQRGFRNEEFISYVQSFFHNYCNAELVDWNYHN